MYCLPFVFKAARVSPWLDRGRIVARGHRVPYCGLKSYTINWVQADYPYIRFYHSIYPWSCQSRKY
ncbi:hypothetical protein ID866_7131 [Astraeus odoratus]|nr:hypothetical protein ID866_7131 [Astraeus odoratus]